MLYAEFLAKVRVRGEYPNQKEAEYVSRTVLALLGTRLDQDQVRDVVHGVPEQVAETLRASSVDGHQLGSDESLATVADKRRSKTLESARFGKNPTSTPTSSTDDKPANRSNNTSTTPMSANPANGPPTKPCTPTRYASSKTSPEPNTNSHASPPESPAWR